MVYKLQTCYHHAMSKEYVFDTETTGLDPKTERIFEIGIIELEGRLPTGRTFHHLLNPEQPLSEASTRITGFRDEDLIGKPTFATILPDLITFIGDGTLIAHNAPFDMSFLHAEFDRTNTPKLKNNVIDTLALAKKKFPGSRHTLDALCNRFGVDSSGRTFHGALLDSELLVEVYTELTGGLQGNILTELEEEETAALTASFKAPKTHNRTPRPTPPTSSEAEAHQSFLKEKLSNTLWSN